jgi:hypothetical protein
MTFAAVGSLIQSTSSLTTFTLVPAGVGHLIVIEIVNSSGAGSGVASALSSSNVTWTAFGAPFTGASGRTSQVFGGKVTAASSATVTITWSGTTPSANVFIDGQEFSSTLGAWAFDTSGHIDSVGTTTWASLTPATSGELYFGYALNVSTANPGSTSGYVYLDDNDQNGVAYRLSCPAGVATAPVWGDTGQAFGIMVLVQELASGAGIPLVQRGGPTWRRFYRRVQRPLLGGGSAAVAVTSSGGLALSPLGMGAAALAGNIATGSLAMSPLAIASTDAETIGSSGSMRLASLGVGAQAAGGNNTSTGSLALKPLGMAGTVTQGVVASGSLALKPLGMAGTAAETFSSTGSLKLNPLKMAGQGAGGNNTSAGSLKLNPLKMAGTAAETFTSTGSLKLQPLAVAGTGAGGAVTATGSLAMSPLAMRGSVGGGNAGAPAAVTDDYRHRMRRRWQRRGW